MSSIVDTVAIPRVQRTRIKGKSYNFDFDCKLGQLIPFLSMECVAGDIVKYGMECVVQFPALIKPLFSEGWKAEMFYFFVPYRIIWKDWENFLPVYATYDENGQNITPSLPLIQSLTDTTLDGKDSATILNKECDITGDNLHIAGDSHSLSDYLNCNTTLTNTVVDLHHRAYLAIFEYFFRDENLDKHVFNFDTKSPIILMHDSPGMPSCYTGGIQTRAWKKDYFTGGLPWLQKGIAPALPLYGSASLFDGSVKAKGSVGSVVGDYEVYPMPDDNDPSTLIYGDSAFKLTGNESHSTVIDNQNPLFVENGVDLSQATSADISELWASMQIQKFLIRNAKVGTRYNEFLLAHYGVAPRDETLQRPQFLGSTSQPIIVSEVTQNSASTTNTTPQGTKTAKAISIGSDYVGKYHVKEPGVLMGIFCCSPKATYTQGIDRFYLKQSPYDFYNRLFENLTDQPTYLGELYSTNVYQSELRETFNFMPRYAEYKISNNRVAGDLRNTLAYWHTGRIFANKPNFNSAFLHKGYDEISNRIMAVQNSNPCVVHIKNKLDMLRPMSYLNMVGAHI